MTAKGEQLPVFSYYEFFVEEKSVRWRIEYVYGLNKQVGAPWSF